MSSRLRSVLEAVALRTWIIGMGQLLGRDPTIGTNECAEGVPGWWPRAGSMRRGAGARHTVRAVERRGVGLVRRALRVHRLSTYLVFQAFTPVLALGYVA